MQFLKQLMERKWSETGLHTRLNSTPNQPLSKAVANSVASPDREYVGSGAGAFVDRSTSQHELDNVQRISDAEDGTAIYHGEIVNTPSIQDNPYIPRIRARKTEDGVSYAIVERLVPFKSDVGNYEVIESMWNRMFSVEWADTEQGIDSAKRLNTRVYELRDEMCELFQRFVGGRPTQDITIVDDQLKEAIVFLRQVKRTHQCGIDIHDENVMIRMTGTMPQLVFTDPFV